MYTPEFRGKQYNQGNLPNSLNDEDVRNQSCNKIWAVLYLTHFQKQLKKFGMWWNGTVFLKWWQNFAKNTNDKIDLFITVLFLLEWYTISNSSLKQQRQQHWNVISN